MMIATNEDRKGLDIPTTLEEHTNRIGNALMLYNKINPDKKPQSKLQCPVCSFIWK